MKVLLAVLEDLFLFVYHALSGAVPYKDKTRPAEVVTTSKLPLNPAQIQYPSPDVLKLEKSNANETHRSPQDTSEENKLPDSFKIGYQYFVGEADVFFYQDPVIAFDGALRELVYGQSVRLVQLQGRWAQVRLGGRLGWVFKDVLRENANSVYPRFEDDEMYDAHHFETRKLRMCIRDTFGGGRGGFPLMAPEYIQYKLQQKHKTIAWNEEHSRIAGTWQRKLRGYTGIHIGITPKTESILEYSMDDIGYQAFVEAVLPDNSIHITQIGKSGSSQYTDEMLTEAQWKELRPVFIDVL